MTSNEIPSQYLPSHNHEQDSELQLIFNDGDDNDDEKDHSTENVRIAGRTYRLQRPPDIGTLFAHQVWSGSKFLADFLANNPHYVEGKRTIEFGAGTVLPSLVALAHGTALSIITDYPDPAVLQCLRETIGCNWDVCLHPASRVAVVGHEWGTSTEGIWDAVCKLKNGGAEDVRFDVAFLSECLWLHRSHTALVQSMDRLLTAQGKAILTYAHHVPGKEKDDDGFFEVAASAGFKITHSSQRYMEYMWDKEKEIVVFLRVIERNL
jgi:predicted nicotinamide N-methyase